MPRIEALGRYLEQHATVIERSLPEADAALTPEVCDPALREGQRICWQAEDDVR